MWLTSRLRLKALTTCQSGLAFLEFALLLPFLVLLLVGTLEIGRFALVNMKLDKAVYALADFVTQGVEPTRAELDEYSQSANQIIKPFNFSGTIIFTSVYLRDLGAPPCEGFLVPCVAWQYRAVGTDLSRVGTPGGNATLPNFFELTEGQNVILAELFADYTPMLDITGNLIPSLAPQKIYKVAMYKPRQGTMFNQPQ
jgi:Flp pilus assembly protein TadG